MAKRISGIDCSNIITDEMSKALIRRLKVKVNEGLKEDNAKLKKQVAKLRSENRRLCKENNEIQDIKAARENVRLACQRLTRIIKAVSNLKERKIGSIINGDSRRYYDTVYREGRAIAAVKRLANKNTP